MLRELSRLGREKAKFDGGHLTGLYLFWSKNRKGINSDPMDSYLIPLVAGGGMTSLHSCACIANVPMLSNCSIRSKGSSLAIVAVESVQ